MAKWWHWPPHSSRNHLNFNHSRGASLEESLFAKNGLGRCFWLLFAHLFGHFDHSSAEWTWLFILQFRKKKFASVYEIVHFNWALSNGHCLICVCVCVCGPNIETDRNLIDTERFGKLEKISRQAFKTFKRLLLLWKFLESKMQFARTSGCSSSNLSLHPLDAIQPHLNLKRPSSAANFRLISFQRFAVGCLQRDWDPVTGCHSHWEILEAMLWKGSLKRKDRLRILARTSVRESLWKPRLVLSVNSLLWANNLIKFIQFFRWSISVHLTPKKFSAQKFLPKTFLGNFHDRTAHREPHWFLR